MTAENIGYEINISIESYDCTPKFLQVSKARTKCINRLIRLFPSGLLRIFICGNKSIDAGSYKGKTNGL